MEEIESINSIKFKVERSNRKTLGISLIEEGYFILKAPKNFTDQQVHSYIRRNEIRLNEALKASQAESVDRKFVDGEDYLFLGKNFRLKIFDNSKAALALEDNYFTIGQFVEQDFKSLFIDWYKAELIDIVQGKVLEYTRVLGVSPKKVVIEDLKDKWGACTPSGVIKINWKLAMAPLSIIDYIVAHELVHLKIKNHSSQFWSQVEALCPKYRDCERWLAENGKELSI